MEADFSGYATKAGLVCSDGRTIMPDAFKHQDSMRVPLVWQHGHKDPENVLGHAILENRQDGVYAYAFFNKSAKAAHARELVEHKDINQMSIWANELIQRGKNVFHGAIREVSLVLSGANPGALIENVTIRHADGESVDLEDEAIIYTGLELEHSDKSSEKEIEHADGEASGGSDKTVQDVYDSLTDEQKQVVHFMIGSAVEEVQAEMKQDNLGDDDANDNSKGNEMKHNVFEGKDSDDKPSYTLSHADIQGIVADATKLGSLKEAVEGFALAHGIDDIDILFPDAKAVDAVPEWIKRRTEWVGEFLGATRKSPFSRIKTLSADLTFEEARAKGYVKGALKKEEWFGISKRVTTPTTVYKKQKLDRDDIVDITDFDVVAWLKAEMRVMLDEEIARAGLIGDGRDVAHEDKVNEQNIRPIATDHELFVTTLNVNLDDASSSIAELVDALVENRRFYKGTGLPTMYTSEIYIAKILQLKDTLGRRIYKTLDEFATEVRVAKVVAVEVMEDEPDLVCILVNPVDYVYGATRGGEVSMFDDFDIDYNQYKYLIETRLCGALTKLKSAIVVRKVAGTDTLVVPNAPTFDPETGALTIVATTGVTYKNSAGDTVTVGGSPYTVAAGETETITAVPAAGKYIASSVDATWKFQANHA